MLPKAVYNGFFTFDGTGAVYSREIFINIMILYISEYFLCGNALIFNFFNCTKYEHVFEYLVRNNTFFVISLSYHVGDNLVLVRLCRGRHHMINT